MTPHPTIAVLGLGNVLLGDDGFGPYVVEVLHATYALPENVSVIDVGTPGLGLSGYLSDSDAVIMVDAISAAGDPGELRLYRRDDIERLPPQPRVSPHDPAVQEALWLVSLAGRGPRDLLLVGVIPERTTVGAGLSDCVRGACAVATQAVIAELTRLGAVAMPRTTMQRPNVWWAGDEP